jgi:ABC-type glycerol-3-phosphate transport system substrate-binding protein
MASGPGGEIYVTDSSGLYRIGPGGESWELMLDGARCSLSQPSVSAMCLIPHGENEFFVNFGGGYGLSGGTLLSNFAYSADTPTLPDSELTVFAMNGSGTVSQAVGVFRGQYPNTLVNIRTAEELTDGGSGDDARRTLNTEILAGNGPDIFIMDDLPAMDYMEKGVLADLSGVIKPLVDSGSILPAVAKAYEREGAIYAIPARVKLPTLWGGEEAVAAANDLDSLLAYAKQNPGKRLFGDMRPQTLLYTLMHGQWQELLDENGVDAAAVEKLFTTIIELSETAEEPHTYIYFGSADFRSNIEEPEYDWNNLNGYHSEELAFAVANSRAELMPVRLDSFADIQRPNGVIFKRVAGITWDVGESDGNTDLPDDIVDKVFRPFPEGGWYEPGCVMGVNAASKQPELANAFILTMLSAETQNADLNDGFPVNREAIAKNVGREETWYTGGSYNVEVGDQPLGLSAEELKEELRLEYAWPSKAMLQAVANRLEDIERPVMEGYPLNIENAMKENLPLALKRVTSGRETPREAAGWLAEELSLAIEE